MQGSRLLGAMKILGGMTRRVGERVGDAARSKILVVEQMVGDGVGCGVGLQHLLSEGIGHGMGVLLPGTIFLEVC